MSLKLTASKPDDRYARFYFVFVGKNEIEARTEEQSDESMGWIEFWSDDARACKDQLRRIAGGRLYVLRERRDKRSKDLSDDKALKELEEYEGLILDGLSYRTKAWRLVNSDNEPIDAPLTFENAKAVYGDDDHNLRAVVQEFLKEREDFPLRAKTSS